MTHEEARALGLRLIAACAALGIDALRLGMPMRHDKAVGLAVVVSRGTARTPPAVAGAWFGYAAGHDCWPDLREGAGRGIALELVREAWDRPGLYAASVASASDDGGEHWRMRDRGCSMLKHAPLGAPSEIAALVVALEVKAGIR